MAFRNKASDVQRHTNALRAQQRERVTIQVAAALRLRNRTEMEMYNEAADSAAATLRQHEIAIDPDSIDNAQRIRRAARDHSRLSNPGPILREGLAPHAFFINAEVTDVDSGLKQQYHYDRCHLSSDWIWDSATVAYIPRHHGFIDLTD